MKHRPQNNSTAKNNNKKVSVNMAVIKKKKKKKKKKECQEKNSKYIMDPSKAILKKWEASQIEMCLKRVASRLTMA